MRKLALVVCGLGGALLATAARARAQDTTTAAGPAPTAAHGESAPIDAIVAVVGDQPILASEVQEQIATLRAKGQQLPTDSAGQAAMFHDVLNQLIDAELLVQEAKAEKVDVNDNDISAAVDKNFASIRGRFTTEAEFRTQLKAAGFGSPDEYRRWLMDQERRTQLQQKLYAKLRQDNKITPAPVSEAEVDSAFEASKGQIAPLPATVTYREIVIAPQPTPLEDSLARMKADSLLVEINKGADFAELAKHESMDPGSKDQGGDLGWHRRGEFVPAFDRVYFALGPGQVSPVIKTTYGYHIIKVDRVQPAEVKGRHILIRPTIDSADVARARRLADSVVALWRNGASYDSLADKFHDPSEEKLMPEPFAQDKLPVEYQNAIKGHKSGDILDPFPIEDKARGVPKFFILQLTSMSGAREPTLADYRQEIRDDLAQQKGVRRYLDTLRKHTYVAIRD